MRAFNAKAVPRLRSKCSTAKNKPVFMISMGILGFVGRYLVRAEIVVRGI